MSESTGLDQYVDVRDIHPDWSMMTCWNCGHTERIGPHRRMRICHHCFMDNRPTDHESDVIVKGPDGKGYADYRLIWFGDVTIEDAQRQYADDTADITREPEVTVRI